MKIQFVKYKNSKGYMTAIQSQGYVKVDSEGNEGKGIYGLVEDGEIVYVGYTNRSFKVREKEHRNNLKIKSNELQLYKYLKKDFEFKPLIDITQLQANSELSVRDIQSMEFALISLYKPKYNIAGVKVPYKYD